jgi:hypothetical protein
MQKIFVAKDVIEANLVKDLLIRGGIAAEIDSEASVGLRPCLQPSVWIMEDTQLQSALALLADLERSNKTKTSKKRKAPK